MNHTFSSHILSQLTNSGFSVTKDVRENRWELKSGKDVLLHNKALGDLCRKAAKELGIDGK